MSAALAILQALVVMVLAVSAAGTWAGILFDPGAHPGEGAWIGTFLLLGAAFLYRQCFWVARS
jgi:hypothetical protein